MKLPSIIHCLSFLRPPSGPLNRLEYTYTDRDEIPNNRNNLVYSALKNMNFDHEGDAFSVTQTINSVRTEEGTLNRPYAVNREFRKDLNAAFADNSLLEREHQRKMEKELLWTALQNRTEYEKDVRSHFRNETLNPFVEKLENSVFYDDGHSLFGFWQSVFSDGQDFSKISLKPNRRKIFQSFHQSGDFFQFCEGRIPLGYQGASILRGYYSFDDELSNTIDLHITFFENDVRLGYLPNSKEIKKWVNQVEHVPFDIQNQSIGIPVALRVTYLGERVKIMRGHSDSLYIDFRVS